MAIDSVKDKYTVHTSGEIRCNQCRRRLKKMKETKERVRDRNGQTREVINLHYRCGRCGMQIVV